VEYERHVGECDEPHAEWHHDGRHPFTGGKERYLGNEWVGRLTYRFAPNVVFDFALAALITGDALNLQHIPAGFGCDTDGIPTCQSRNVYKATARVRVTF